MHRPWFNTRLLNLDAFCYTYDTGKSSRWNNFHLQFADSRSPVYWHEIQLSHFAWQANSQQTNLQVFTHNLQSVLSFNSARARAQATTKKHSSTKYQHNCVIMLFFPWFFLFQSQNQTHHTNLMWKHHFKGNSHLLKRWSFIFPTAPRRATSVFLTFRVSHCIKLPGSPYRCHGGKMDHPIFDGRKTTCKCYWFWNFLFLMSKVPIKMGILMVSKIKFGEIWDFLCYECYLSLAEDTRSRTKLYVIVCIYIYTYWIRPLPRMPDNVAVTLHF